VRTGVRIIYVPWREIEYEVGIRSTTRLVKVRVPPTFFADQVNEPVLVIHGNADSNPGTVTFQSEVFFEAVRGSGGTARLVLLPFEDHGYRARESVEHVLWEQIRWFDEFVKNAE
jgi:dipeptidyl aminopeptidase/acylaminoacyl peptidase